MLRHDFIKGKTYLLEDEYCYGILENVKDSTAEVRAKFEDEFSYLKKKEKDELFSALRIRLQPLKTAGYDAYLYLKKGLELTYTGGRSYHAIDFRIDTSGVVVTMEDVVNDGRRLYRV